ncbi:hypothetical protein RF11_10636 [Thelohanellus kitauei]|uniref:Uncharacterized protein n=1 Tax=Thelohanellus kitauei TaxID=669202 RepID=A0A0C2N5B5_THEKT|nr:hypothetical protein RF11_10636 [Thelohanellus kitauei]
METGLINKKHSHSSPKINRFLRGDGNLNTTDWNVKTHRFQENEYQLYNFNRREIHHLFKFHSQYLFCPRKTYVEMMTSLFMKLDVYCLPDLKLIQSNSSIQAE